MAVTVTIDGTDVSLYIFEGKLVQTSAYKLRTLELTLGDDSSNTVLSLIDNGLDVQVSDGSLQFRGIVEDYEFREDRQIDLYCVDYSYYLAEQYITYDAAGQTAGQIVNDLVDTYGNSLFTKNIASTTNTYDIVWKAYSPLEIMLELASLEGHVFFVSPTRVVTFQPDGYDDTGVTLEDGVDIHTRSFPSVSSKLKNVITVIGRGGNPETGGVIVTVDEPDSIAKLGRRELRIEDNQITTEDQAIARAESELRRRAYPLVTGELQIARNFSLTAGSIIRVTMSQRGWTAKQFLIVEATHQIDLPITLLKLAEIADHNADQLSEMLLKQRQLEKHFEDESTSVTRFQRWSETLVLTAYAYVEKQSTLTRRRWNEGSWNASPSWNYQDSNWTIVLEDILMVLTNLGLKRIRDLIKGAAVTPLDGGSSYIALGSGTTAAQVTDTALETETANSRQGMDSGFPRDGTGTAEVEHQASITDSEIVSGIFSEIGLLDASSGGTLIARVVPSTSFTKNANEVLRTRTKIVLTQ